MRVCRRRCTQNSWVPAPPTHPSPPTHLLHLLHLLHPTHLVQLSLCGFLSWPLLPICRGPSEKPARPVAIWLRLPARLRGNGLVRSTRGRLMQMEPWRYTNARSDSRRINLDDLRDHRRVRGSVRLQPDRDRATADVVAAISRDPAAHRRRFITGCTETEGDVDLRRRRGDRVVCGDC